MGFLRVLRFPPTGKVDRVGWDRLAVLHDHPVSHHAKHAILFHNYLGFCMTSVEEEFNALGNENLKMMNFLKYF